MSDADSRVLEGTTTNSDSGSGDTEVDSEPEERETSKTKKAKLLKPRMRDAVDKAREEASGKNKEKDGEKEGGQLGEHHDNRNTKGLKATTGPHGDGKKADGSDKPDLTNKVQARRNKSFVFRCSCAHASIDPNTTTLYSNPSDCIMGPPVDAYMDLNKGWPSASGVEPERPSVPLQRVSKVSATGSAGTSSNQQLSRADTIRPTTRRVSNTVATAKLAKKCEVNSEHNAVAMGGISDEDEINGPERQYAINSPLKGKKRLTSSVIPHDFLFSVFVYNLIYLPGSRQG